MKKNPKHDAIDGPHVNEQGEMIFASLGLKSESEENGEVEDLVLGDEDALSELDEETEFEFEFEEDSDEDSFGEDDLVIDMDEEFNDDDDDE